MNADGPGEAPREDYGAIRRRLQERGYLVGPVDRFVLLPQIGLVSSAGILGAAAKASVVGGAILSAILSAVLAWSERPLDRASDLPLLWLYLLLPAILATFVFDLLAARTVTALLGRRGADTRIADPTRAAAVSAVVALLYVLTLWWVRAGGSLVEDLLFVVLAVPAVSAIGYLAGLVSLAGIVRRTGDVPARRRGRRALVFAVALVVGVLALLARPILLRDSANRLSTPAPVPTRSGRVLVVGVDGLDAELLAGLAERGRLGGLMHRIEEGATFPLHRGAAAEPAEVWTTIATGLPGRIHGVHAAHAARLPGVGTTLRGGGLPLWTVWRSVLPLSTVPATRGIRRVPTVWEIASAHVGTAVVGWWASWPAAPEASDGAPVRYVVTDRVLAKLLTDSPPDRDTTPAALFERIRAGFPEEVARLRDEFSARFAGVASPVADRVWESLLIDAFACDRAAELLTDPSVRVAFAYLPGFDILRQRLEGTDTERFYLLELYSTAIEERLLSLLGTASGTTVLVGDHGRGPAAEGFVAIRGPEAEPACVGPVVSELALAPLLLRLIGLPESREMPATAPSRCFEPPSSDRGSVASYGRLAPEDRRATSASDPEILERLRSLGYVR